MISVERTYRNSNLARLSHLAPSVDRVPPNWFKLSRVWVISCLQLFIAIGTQQPQSANFRSVASLVPCLIECEPNRASKTIVQIV
jgi:hypothetical protein